MRVLFTGGSGKAGRWVVPYLAARGHTVVNVDLTPLGHPGVEDRHADIADNGQMWGVLTQYASMDEVGRGEGVRGFDAVVHFAAIPRILLRTDAETFRINTLGTYNVIEAALGLGVRKIVFASSETTYGICFADGVRKPDYLPVDEDHPTMPEDSYAMSKVAGEDTARSFQRRSGADIYGLRINNVMEPDDYRRLWPGFFAEPAVREGNVFAYIDARDLGQIVDRCLATDGLGYRVFNAANDTHSVPLTTAEIVERFYPGVELRREMGEFETLYCNRRIRDELGFEEVHDWRRYLADPRGA